MSTLQGAVTFGGREHRPLQAQLVKLQKVSKGPSRQCERARRATAFDSTDSKRYILDYLSVIGRCTGVACKAVLNDKEERRFLAWLATVSGKMK